MNQRLPSGPAVIPPRLGKRTGMTNSLITPLGVILPILPTKSLPNSVNQTLPSGPAVIDRGLPATGNSVMTPPVEILPILSRSVNQRLPSGPAVIVNVPLLGVGMENSVKTWAETFTEYASSPIAHTRILPIAKPTLFTVLTPGAQGFDRRLLRFSDQLMSTRSP